GLSAIPIVPPRCVKPIVRALVDIKLLCQPCHVCKHSYDRRYMHHWCWVNGASPEAFHEHYRSARIQWKDAITIAGYFSGFDDLPDYTKLTKNGRRLCKTRLTPRPRTI